MSKAFDDWFEGYIQGLETGFDGGHEAARDAANTEFGRLRAIEAAARAMVADLDLYVSCDEGWLCLGCDSDYASTPADIKHIEGCTVGALQRALDTTEGTAPTEADQP